MVKFLGFDDVSQLVRSYGVAKMIRGVAECLEEDYHRWNDFEKSARVANHAPMGVVELMPISDATQYAFKYVTGHPDNPKQGLPTVAAFGMLADMETGFPRLISEMSLLTALRTAAMSALTASRLARKDAASMALIGAGAQSEFQAIAFRELLGIRKLKVYDCDRAASEKFLSNMVGYGDLDIVLAETCEEAVTGVDIITTATADKKNAKILTENMVGGGVHINAVGGDCPGKTELEAAILKRANVFVEFTPQTRIEGEIQQMDADFQVTELWEVFSGDAPGRTADIQTTIFDSVGFALEDFSVLRYVYKLIEEGHHGKHIDLVGQPEDPRDLFGAAMQTEATEPAVRRKGAAAC